MSNYFRLPRILSRFHRFLGWLKKPAPVPAPSPWSATLGLCTHGLDRDSLYHLHRLGVRHVRFRLYWPSYESSADYRRIWNADIDHALALGFEILVVVHAEASPRTSEGLPEFMRQVAARHPDVEAWQIGNENGFPDLVTDGRAYARMHEDCYYAIKAANPRAKVITIARTPEQLLDPWTTAFLDADPPYDALAIHLYGWPLAERHRAGRLFTRLYLRDLYHTPIWITETGMDLHTQPVEERADWEKTQADQWRTLLERNNLTGWAERVYGYILMAGMEDETMGVYRRPDWHERKVAGVIRSYVENSVENSGGAR